jgi:hypothetical protein
MSAFTKIVTVWVRYYLAHVDRLEHLKISRHFKFFPEFLVSIH